MASASVDAQFLAPTECARFLLSAAFSFGAGYADVLSVRLYGVFATMMTGNTFMIGSELVSGKQVEFHNSPFTCRAWKFRLAVIAAFCLGLLAVEFLSARVKCLGAATILAPPIAIITVVLSYVSDHARLHVIAMAAFFGIQHGVSAQGLGASTTMVTGHLVKLSKELTKIRSRADAADMSHKNLIGIACVTFIIVGAMVGELSVEMHKADKISFLTMFAPVGPIMAVLLVINDHIFHKGDIDVIRKTISKISWFSHTSDIEDQCDVENNIEDSPSSSLLKGTASHAANYGTGAVASGGDAVGSDVKGETSRAKQDHQQPGA
jgi:uncharacterized membrane protein YoaK (UPF0700 family)